MELNIVQTLMNIRIADLIMEGKSLTKQHCQVYVFVMTGLAWLG